MEQILVSVIIPAYNAEKYIEETLDSLIAQSLKNVNFEAICINDGSTDSTPNILERYANKDERFIVLSQENVGRSIARNAGIEKAKGKYVLFLDSDDLLAPNTLEVLVQACEKDNLDIVYFNAEPFLHTTKGEALDANLQKQFKRFERDYKRTHTYPVLDGKDMMTKMWKNKEYLSSACFQMTKLSHIQKYNLHFIPGIIHEDNAYTFQAILQAKHVGYIPEEFYLRRVHENSTMTRAKNFSHAYGYFRCYLALQQFLLENAKQLASYSVPVEINFQILRNARMSYLEVQKTSKEEDKKEQDKKRQSFNKKPTSIDDLLPFERFYFKQFVIKPATREVQLKRLQRKREQLKKIEQSKSYRATNVILRLPRKLKRAIQASKNSQKEQDSE